MQRKSFSKAMAYLVAVCALVSVLAMFACGGDDDEDAVRNFVSTVPVGNSTVPAVQAGLLLSRMARCSVGLSEQPNQLDFHYANHIALTRTGISLSGNVTMARTPPVLLS